MYLRERFQTSHRIFLITIILLIVGIVMVCDSSSVCGEKRFGDAFYFFKREIFWAVIGLSFFFLMGSFDYRRLRFFSKPLVLISLFLLCLPFILGHSIKGTYRWIRLAGFSFQPSEFAKIALLIYLSDFLSRKKERLKEFVFGFLPLVIILGASIILILLEPDLGTSLLIAAVSGLLLFVSGMRLSYLYSSILLSLPFIYLLIFRVPYRKRRILAFLNPRIDPQGIGWHITQSLIALGSGGPFGLGLGNSRQKLLFLPEAHTDSIFAIIGEELGILSLLIPVLFFLYLKEGIKVSKKIEDNFGSLLSFGIVSLITMQAILHIGVVCGLFPAKGLPLPFISYGGSSLVCTMAISGILFNISKHLPYET